MSDDEPLENGYGPNTVAGDNLLNDYVRGEAFSVVELAGARGERTFREPGRVAMADGASPLPFSNVLVLERPPDRGPEELVAEARDFFGGRPGGPALIKSLFPLADLTAHGCTLMGHPPLMLRTPGALPEPPGDLEIVEVSDERTSRDYEETLVLGYPAPMLQPFRVGCFLPAGSLDALGWHHFVGYADGRPVAVGSSYADDYVVRVENIAAMGHSRGRGFGAAITAAAIGVNATIPATLVSSDIGRRTYEKLGFRALQRATYWLVPR